jgi:hypothetical protein
MEQQNERKWSWTMIHFPTPNPGVIDWNNNNKSLRISISSQHMLYYDRRALNPGGALLFHTEVLYFFPIYSQEKNHSFSSIDHTKKKKINSRLKFTL